jgi:SAM-dependent methyltransferase
VDDKKTDEISLFYKELKQKDSKRRTVNSELIGRQHEIANKGLTYYVLKEVREQFDDQINAVLNVGGDLGIDLILIRKYGIDVKQGDSVDLFLPPEKVDFPTYIYGNVYDLPEILHGKKYDLILLKEVIEHLYDPDRAIISIKEVMKIDGTIIITTPNLSSLINRLLLFFGFLPMSYEVSTKKTFGKPGRFNMREGAAGHIRLFTFRAIKEFLEYYGFSVVRMYTIPAPPSDDLSITSWVILFEKILHKISKKLCSSIIIVAKITSEQTLDKNNPIS